MPIRRVDDTTKKEIARLFKKEGVIPKEIARRLDVSYGSVYALTYGKMRGYCSYTHYHSSLARQAPA